MISNRIHITSATPSTVDLEVVTFVPEAGEPGIKKVRVLDRDGAEIAARYPEEECPASFTFRVAEVPQTRFPIEVEATDCSDAVTPPEPIQLLPPGIVTETPGVALPCSPEFCPPDPGCRSAQSRLEGLRHQINVLCNELAAMREAYELFMGLAIAMLVLFAIFMVVGAVLSAIPFAQSAGTAMVVFALAFLALAVLAFAAAYVWNGRMAEKMREIREAQAEFGRAASGVLIECCPACVFVDLSPPGCGG